MIAGGPPALGAYAVSSVSAFEQFARLTFQIEAIVLIRPSARDRGDALYKVIERCRRMPLLIEHSGDNPRGIRFGKVSVAQKANAILVATRDDALARCRDTLDEIRGRRLDEVVQGGLHLMRKMAGRKFRMADFDLLEILDAPEISVHADRAQVKGRDAEGVRTHF